ncbi:hypothetical protein TB2_021604 [Malus domestica]
MPKFSHVSLLQLLFLYAYHVICRVRGIKKPKTKLFADGRYHGACSRVPLFKSLNSSISFHSSYVYPFSLSLILSDAGFHSTGTSCTACGGNLGYVFRGGTECQSYLDV